MTGNLISGGQAIEAAGVATDQIRFGGISLPGFISDDSVMWTPLDDYHVDPLPGAGQATPIKR